ncbi:MAG TPA: hypothetical protein VLI67_01070 [Vicinamibacteria bacterium]|nr:hypothetical protein [Vicinamibacteria bacterium]
MRSFDAIMIGAGQAGPSLMGRLTQAGMAVALVERLSKSPHSSLSKAAPSDSKTPTTFSSFRA